MYNVHVYVGNYKWTVYIYNHVSCNKYMQIPYIFDLHYALYWTKDFDVGQYVNENI